VLFHVVLCPLTVNVMPECSRQARPRAMRGQGVSGIQLISGESRDWEFWIPAESTRE
jgi:hypothetical protein